MHESFETSRTPQVQTCKLRNVHKVQHPALNYTLKLVLIKFLTKYRILAEIFTAYKTLNGLLCTFWAIFDSFSDKRPTYDLEI